MKVRITYISHRGSPGYQKLYPQQHQIDVIGAIKLSDAVSVLQRDGFYRLHQTSARSPEYNDTWVPPSAIIEIRQEGDQS